MAQRIRHLTTNQGIPGSNPGRVEFFFFPKRYKMPYGLKSTFVVDLDFINSLLYLKL